MWTVYHRHGEHFFVHETDQEFERTKRFYRLFQINTESGSEFYENARGDIHAWRVEDDPERIPISQS